MGLEEMRGGSLKKQLGMARRRDVQSELAVKVVVDVRVDGVGVCEHERLCPWEGRVELDGFADAREGDLGKYFQLNK